MVAHADAPARQRVGADARGGGSARLWFGLLGAPAAWSLHLLVSYAVHALGCEAGWPGLRWWLVGVTALFGAAAAAAGIVAYGYWSRAHAGGLATEPPPPGAAAFVGLSGALLSVVFVAGILLGGLLPALTLPLCQ